MLNDPDFQSALHKNTMPRHLFEGNPVDDTFCPWTSFQKESHIEALLIIPSLVKDGAKLWDFPFLIGIKSVIPKVLHEIQRELNLATRQLICFWKINFCQLVEWTPVSRR